MMREVEGQIAVEGSGAEAVLESMRGGEGERLYGHLPGGEMRRPSTFGENYIRKAEST